MKHLAIVTTHPIQYYAPFFALLSQRKKCHIKVFYTWPQAVNGFNDVDFGTQVKWDIPLLNGYNYQFIENISQLPSSKDWKGIDNPSLIREVKQFNPDAILIFGWKYKSHFALMRYFKGKVPIWFRGDSTLIDERPGYKTWIRRMVLRFVYRYVDKAFYVGSNNKEYFLKHGLKINNLILSPHAVDNDRFEDDKDQTYEKAAQNWRNSLGIKKDEKVVLFAGKLESKKAPNLLLKAILQLNSKSKQAIKLIIAGSGHLKSQLKELAGDNPNIIFLPFQNQSQMPVLYRLADVFCLPSKGPSETWGLVVNEALACGRPVLTSDKVGCAIDIVEPQVGRIFNSNDISDLKTKIIELVGFNKNPEICQEHIRKWRFEAICDSIESELNNLK